MKKIILFLVSFVLILTVFGTSKPAYAYTDGYANGKPVGIMKPDAYYIGRATEGSTDLLTDNNEETSYVAPSNKWLVINLGQNRTIDSYRLKSEAKSLRIIFYDQDGGYLRTIETMGGNGELTKLPNDLTISRVKFITIYSLKSEEITINEVDFFNSKEIKPIPEPAPEPVPVPEPTPEPTEGNHAILTITMITGLEKEYDLPMNEVKEFITWYENNGSGNGQVIHSINKYGNNKGPFNNRKEYIVLKNILSFEVDTYISAS